MRKTLITPTNMLEALRNLCVFVSMCVCMGVCSSNYYCEECFQSTYPKYELNLKIIWIDVYGQRFMSLFLVMAANCQ